MDTFSNALQKLYRIMAPYTKLNLDKMTHKTLVALFYFRLAQQVAISKTLEAHIINRFS